MPVQNGALRNIAERNEWCDRICSRHRFRSRAAEWGIGLTDHKPFGDQSKGQRKGRKLYIGAITVSGSHRLTRKRLGTAVPITSDSGASAVYRPRQPGFRHVPTNVMNGSTRAVAVSACGVYRSGCRHTSHRHSRTSTAQTPSPQLFHRHSSPIRCRSPAIKEMSNGPAAGLLFVDSSVPAKLPVV